MATRGRKRFSAKSKSSKSMAYQKHKADTDLQKIKSAISKGAKLEKTGGFWSKEEYWIKYPEGGQHRITKRIYDKLSS